MNISSVWLSIFKIQRKYHESGHNVGVLFFIPAFFPSSLAQRETYKLEATAQDKGYPPLSRSVEVQIDVVDRANNPPVWDHTVYGPIFIRENFPVGAKVVSVKARSVCAETKLPSLSYLLFLFSAAVYGSLWLIPFLFPLE